MQSALSRLQPDPEKVSEAKKCKQKHSRPENCGIKIVFSRCGKPDKPCGTSGSCFFMPVLDQTSFTTRQPTRRPSRHALLEVDLRDFMLLNTS